MARNGRSKRCDWVWDVIILECVASNFFVAHEIVEGFDFLIRETEAKPSADDGCVAVDVVKGVSDDVFVGESVFIREMTGVAIA